MIDCHVHFWSYCPVDFPWITGKLSPIAQDMSPQQLWQDSHHHIDGVIAIQARPCVDENVFLCQLAKENKKIKGVITWFDFDQGPDSQIEFAQKSPLIKGFRHQIQDEKNPSEYLRDHDGLYNAMKPIQSSEFVYEVLIHQDHLPAAVEFCAKHDQYWLIIDHLAKPTISNQDDFLYWQHHMHLLSQMEHVIVKISGLVTQGEANSKADLFQQYLDTIIAAFGVERLIWGSDWPVSSATHSYQTLINFWSIWNRNLNRQERLSIEEKTPQRIYRL